MERHRAAVIEKLKSSVQHADPGIAAERRSYIQKWAEIQTQLIKRLENDDLQFLYEILQNENCWSIARLKDIGIILLAFKHNKVTILECLLNSDCKNYNKTAACRKTTMLTNENVETCHYAFYYAIRLGNVELLEGLIKWSRNYFSSHLSNLDQFISRAYDELKLKNVYISEEMDVFVENELINLRFFSDVTGKYQNVERDPANINERIALVLENIRFLNTEYSNIKEVDEKFFFIAKFIAQNIHILKRQLKSTYDRLPWEEIEFCLVNFITFHIKQQGDAFYNVILNKSKILNHLENFAKKLDSEKPILESMNVFPKLNRDKVVANIVRKHPEFKELYIDYQHVKDIHTLEKISDYIKLAVSADPKQREGQIIITRVLQVIGEYLKNTLESPNLSSTTSELLLLSLPKNTRTIIIDLRNSLSHAFSLAKRTEIEENKNVNFFIGVQNDTKRIDDVITDILNNNKMKMMRVLLKKIINSESPEEMKELSAAFRKVKTGNDLITDSFKLMEHDKLETLIKKLTSIITDKTNYEMELFNSLAAVINLAKTKSKSFDTDFFKAINLLKCLAVYLLNNKINPIVIDEIKSRAEKILSNIPSLLEPHSLREIAFLTTKIFYSAKSRMLEKNTVVLDKVHKLCWEILYIIQIETEDLNFIEKLRDNLNEKNSYIPVHKLKKCNNVPEKERIKHLKSKLTELKSVLKSNALNDNLYEQLSSYKEDKKLQAVVEMLVLDIMSILDLSENHLEKNTLFFLDDNTPLLTGKSLRNHLAHDNTLTDILLTDPSIAIILNAKKLTSENLIKGNKKVGKYVEDDPIKLRDRFKESLNFINDQEKMFTALEKGNIDDLKNYLIKGADINARDINLSTALHFASRGTSLKIVKFLIDQKLSVNVKDVKGQNPLHVAAAYGRKNIVEFFIEEIKMHINDLDNSGKTPLHVAAKNGHKDVVELLLKNNANTNITNNAGSSPFHTAITEGHIDVAMILFDEVTNVNTNEAVSGDTPLHLAADIGCLRLVNFLLENGANVDVTNDNQSTPLHIAAAKGFKEVVNALIFKKADVNSRVIDGSTPLHYAIESGHEETVKILLKHGADVNIAEKSYNNAPLHYAVLYKREKIVKILLSNKANSSIRQIDGLTALHLAVQVGNLEIVTALLEHGVDVSAKVNNNASPIHYAADGNHEAIAQLLIKYGANVNDVDNELQTPISIAAFKGHKEILELLLKNKAKLGLRNRTGNTEMHAAATNGSADIINILIKKGAYINQKNNDGTTPLHMAAVSGHMDAVALLIENKVEINSRDNSGRTPLHAATTGGHKKVVELLISNKAELNTKCKSGSTPFHEAVKAGFKEIVMILVKNGANVNAKLDEYTPLILAIENLYADIVEILIENGARISEKEGELLQPLSVAVMVGNNDIVEILLKNNACIDLKDPEKFTLLHFAARRGNKDILKTLITRGIDVNAVTTHNITPLFFAAQEGHEAIVEILINNRANIDVVCIDCAPIHIAAGRGHDNVIEVLLRHGANVDIKDTKNRTAFEWAVLNGHLTVVKMLQQYKKVDFNARYDHNRTILHIAAEEGKLEMIKYLVEEGSDINAKNYLDSKPIHIAARDGYKDIVEYFLSKGLSVNELGQSNQTLLHYAAMTGRLEVIKYLIEQGADVNSKDVNGFTPTHFAAIFNSKDVVEIFLKHGAVFDAVEIENEKPSDMTNNKDIINLINLTEKLFESVEKNNSLEVEKDIKAGACINAKKVDRGTPLHHAARRGHDEIVKILLQNKANPNATDSKKFSPLHYAAKFSHLKTVKILLANGAVYNLKSNGGKKPSDLAVDRAVINLFKLIDESFEKVMKNNIRLMNDLSKIKDIETMKAVTNACNRDCRTLVVVAMLNNFSKVEQLKQVLQTGISSQIEEGKQQLRQGNYQASLNILKIALETRKEILGPKNPGTLDIQMEIGIVLYKEGNYQEALNLYEEIYQIQKQILGSNDKHTLKTRSNIALMVGSQGKDEEALNIFKEVRENQKELLGPDHEDVLYTEFHMAAVLNRQDKCEQALSIYKKVFEKKKKILGVRHIETVSAQNNIASVLSRQGKYEESLKIYYEVYHMKTRILGADHTDTLRTLQNIASSLFSQNKYRDAQEIYQRVLNFQKKKPEQFHIEILNTQYLFGSLLLAQGKYISALKLFKESFDQRESFFGLSHKSIFNILKMIESINLQYQLHGTEPSQLLKHLQKDISNAAIQGNLQKVRQLLKGGADPNDKDLEGRTPLHYAVDNDHIDIVKILLENGAIVSQVTNKGNTPLHTATSKCNKKIIEILLNHVSADKLNDFINAKTTSSGTTSLHVAAKGGSFEIVKFLLKRGAAYDINNKEGKTPADISKDQEVISLLRLIEELFRDVKHGSVKSITKLKAMKRDDFLAATNARNNHGNTLVKVAMDHKHKNIASVLLTMLKNLD